MALATACHDAFAALFKYGFKYTGRHWLVILELFPGFHNFGNDFYTRAVTHDVNGVNPVLSTFPACKVINEGAEI